MPGQLRNALPPPSFLSLPVLSSGESFRRPGGLCFLQAEAATAPGGLHTSSAVPLTSVAGFGVTCLQPISSSSSICSVGFESEVREEY